jgi:hypothetical protein
MAFRGTVGSPHDMPVMSFKESDAKFVVGIMNGSKSDVAVDPLFCRHPEQTQAHDLGRRDNIQGIGMKPDNCGTRSS